MFELKNTIVSNELLEEEFVCNLSACKGACCVAGDAGAPLETAEYESIKKDLDKILPYLSKKGQDAIEHQGAGVEDPFKEDEMVTPLIDGKECAFTIFEDGKAACGIERAWQNGDSSLQKPISCHLYPVRLKKYESFTAVNYDRWDICSEACILGQELQVPVYRFLKDSLIRKFGEDWYRELEAIAES